MKLARILVLKQEFYETALLAAVVEDEAEEFVETEAAGPEAAGVAFSSLEALGSPLGSEEGLEMPVAPVDDFLESLI